MKKYVLATGIWILALFVSTGCKNQQKSVQTPTIQSDKTHPDLTKPNVLIIYIDDLGYGDLSCYGATAFKTPAVDALAANGIRFTDGHCSAATCTPSRFSLLTGSYAFRNNAAILPGDAPLFIRPDTYTLPDMLKNAGYHTGVVGKWHLGLGDGNVNWNEEIKPGPREIGFDYSFLIPATGDRVPCVFVENQRVVNIDSNDPIEVNYNNNYPGEVSGLTHPHLLKMKADTQHSCAIVDSISRIGYMKGGSKARWRDTQFADILTDQAIQFMDEAKEKPFFLYFALQDIHVPRVPHPRFAGKSGLGPRGDAILQMDWCVEVLVNALKKRGKLENTLILFSSDNGPVLDDGYDDFAVQMNGAHKPGGLYRGGKYSSFEAGTRVPTIVHWPARVKKGVSKALVSHIDIMATLAELTGQSLPANAAPDSEARVADWLGTTQNGRPELVEEGFSFSLRQGDWKYIEPLKKAGPSWLKNKKIEMGISQKPQLYNLAKDPYEKTDVAAENPAIVEKMQTRMDAIRQQATRK